MKRYIFPDGEIISQSGGHEINGERYGKTDFTRRWGELYALGVREYRVDFDVPAGYEADGQEVVTEIDADTGEEVRVRRPTGVTPIWTLEAAKDRKIVEIKRWAYLALQDTDWRVIRAAETGEDLDADIIAARAAIRDASDAMEAEVAALDNYDAVIAWEVSDVSE